MNFEKKGVGELPNSKNPESEIDGIDDDIDKEAQLLMDHIEEKFPFDEVGEGFKRDVTLHLTNSLVSVVKRSDTEEVEKVVSDLLDKIGKSYREMEKVKTKQELEGVRK